MATATKAAKLNGKTQDITAAEFIKAMHLLQSPAELKKLHRYFEFDEKDKKDTFMGVRMGELFKLSKGFMGMSLKGLETLMESPYQEIRTGAVSIMDFEARDKKTTPERKKALYDLYIRRHDRINNWGMVDRSAPYVIGGYLHDKPRKILYKLAKSKDPWERRTAIVSTYYFIRQKDTDDTFKIGEILIHDEDEYVQKAVGSWIREAGKQDKARLLKLLDKYAATMPRVMLRYMIEKLSKAEREKYLSKGKT